MECPKCDAAVDPTARACPRCGLARAFWERYAPPRPSPALEVAWDACEAAWDDPARHDAALAAASPGELALLARRYRGRAADPVTERALARIATIVELGARAQLGRPIAPATVLAVRVLAVLLALALATVTAWMTWRVVRGRT